MAHGGQVIVAAEREATIVRYLATAAKMDEAKYRNYVRILKGQQACEPSPLIAALLPRLIEQFYERFPRP